jgi:polyisoprenoid-binding protein YceI
VTRTDDLRPPRLAAATIVALVTMLVFSSPARAATAWVADPARSRLEFVATQAGGEFEGRFRRFSANIAFDPGDLAGSRFRVTIDTASADTQDETRDQALIGDEFFASGRWPTATFDASRFTTLPGGRYQARGRLTIRGISRDVNVLFTFTPATDGRGAVLAGGTTIRRLDFDVGQGEWQDTKWVGNDVRIEFELALQQGPARANDGRP